MLKKFYLLLFISVVSYAQKNAPQLNAEAVSNRIGEITNPRAVRDFDFRYQGMIGSQFLINEWVTGNVFFNDGKLAKNQGTYKYNTYTKELYLKRSATDSIIVNADEIQEFQLNISKDGELVKFVKPSLLKVKEDKLANTFLRIIYDGPTALVKNHSQIFKKADYKGVYSQDKRYDEFVDASEYFIVKNGKASKIKLKPGQVLEVLQDREKEIKTFMKEQDLDARTEGEVVKILEFYDTLK